MQMLHNMAASCSTAVCQQVRVTSVDATHVRKPKKINEIELQHG
jgi:hypothetical protein